MHIKMGPRSASRPAEMLEDDEGPHGAQPDTDQEVEEEIQAVEKWDPEDEATHTRENAIEDIRVFGAS